MTSRFSKRDKPLEGKIPGLSDKETAHIKAQVTLAQWQVYQTLRRAGALDAKGLTNDQLCTLLDKEWGKKAKATWLDRRNELAEMGYCRMQGSGANNKFHAGMTWVACLPWEEAA